MDQSDPAMHLPTAIIDAATVERLAIPPPYSPGAVDADDWLPGKEPRVSLADVARSFMWIDRESSSYDRVARFAVSLLTYIDRDLEEGLLGQERLPNLSAMLDEVGTSEQLTGRFLAAYQRAIQRALAGEVLGA